MDFHPNTYLLPPNNARSENIKLASNEDVYTCGNVQHSLVVVNKIMNKIKVCLSTYHNKNIIFNTLPVSPPQNTGKAKTTVSKMLIQTNQF